METAVKERAKKAAYPEILVSYLKETKTKRITGGEIVYTKATGSELSLNVIFDTKRAVDQDVLGRY